MELIYKSASPVLSLNQKKLVPVKNFWNDQRPVLAQEIGVGSFCNEQLLEDKLYFGDSAYFVFSDFKVLPQIQVIKNGYSLAVITLSDKGYRGERQDTSGPKIEEMLPKVVKITWSQRYVISDDPLCLKHLFARLIYFLGVDLIITTGGTGVYMRDITPEITLQFLDKRLPGFEQAMLIKSLAKTPHAVISRAVCGLAQNTLVINLPGSIKAVQENLDAVLPALNHCLAKIHGDPTDCA